MSVSQNKQHEDGIKTKDCNLIISEKCKVVINESHEAWQSAPSHIILFVAHPGISHFTKQGNKVKYRNILIAHRYTGIPRSTHSVGLVLNLKICQRQGWYR